MSKTKIWQIGIVSTCLFLLVLWATSFPYPSPVIKPLLTGRAKYPGRQIVEWIDSGAFPKDFLEWFSRDPERIVPPGNNLVSPADGVVREILVEDDVTYIMIQLTFWDVHVIRSPINGVISDIEAEGITMFKTDPKDVILLRGKIAPTQKILTLDSPIGEVKIRMITNYWASRVKVWAGYGQSLDKGERVGRMLAGSTVVLEVPSNIPLNLQERQLVVGGETILTPGEMNQ